MASPSRIVNLHKSDPDMKLGVRLGDAKKGGAGGVKIVDINPIGPMASLVKKGDLLMSINGVSFDTHQEAAALLAAATGDIRIELGNKVKKKSLVSRFSGRSSSGTITVEAASPASAPPESPTRDAAETSEREELPDASDAEPPAEPTAIATPTRSADAASAATPFGLTPGPLYPSAGSGALPPLSTDDLGPGEYRVILQRNKTASIGMRLVQKRHADQPFIADIDPHGPAASTEIAVGDLLLEVNGVDARSSHSDLKRALSATENAVLKLRKAPKPSASRLPTAGHVAKRSAVEDAAGKGTLSFSCGDDGGVFGCGCCVSREAVSTA